MRIIGGEARGRRLFTPGNASIRPTNDRIKEAFFNIIRDIDGKTFLDLFAGTGSVGLEALSRGAIKAAFIENDRGIVDILKKNIALCGFAAKSEILAVDCFTAIKKLAERREGFDIIFADPPYEQGLGDQILEKLQNGLITAEKGLLIVQHSIREKINHRYVCGLDLSDQRRYGDTILSIFKG